MKKPGLKQSIQHLVSKLRASFKKGTAKPKTPQKPLKNFQLFPYHEKGRNNPRHHLADHVSGGIHHSHAAGGGEVSGVAGKDGVFYGIITQGIPGSIQDNWSRPCASNRSFGYSRRHDSSKFQMKTWWENVTRPMQSMHLPKYPAEYSCWSE